MTATPIPWRRVRPERIDVPDHPMLGGSMTLANGERIVIPGDALPPDAVDMVVARRFDMVRTLGHAGGARVRIANGRLTAVARRIVWHPLDAAILSAFGRDHAQALRRYAEDAVWWQGASNFRPFDDAYVKDGDGRLTWPVDYGEDDVPVTYEGLTFAVRAELPESIVAALAGRQLHDVVDLPPLRGMRLPIVSVDAFDKLGAETRRSMGLLPRRIRITVDDGSAWREIE